jgi:hypothetical protein
MDNRRICDKDGDSMTPMAVVNPRAMPAENAMKLNINNAAKAVSCPMVFRSYSPLLGINSDEPALRKRDLEDCIREFSLWLTAKGRFKLPVTDGVSIEKQFINMPGPEEYLRNISEAVFRMHEVQSEPLNPRAICSSLKKEIFDAIVEIEDERFEKSVEHRPGMDRYRMGANAVSRTFASYIANHFASQLAEILERSMRAVA